MGDKKVVFKLFTIYQYQQEEEYLCAMHAQGWRVTKISFPGLYQFEKCEPKSVTYRLDYNQEGLTNKTEYVQMFYDCGWDYLFEFMGYAYFCKQTEHSRENEEIFCDDFSRLEMMKRVFQSRIIPLIILFACMILPQFFMITIGYGGFIQEVLSVCMLLFTMSYLVIFSVTAYQFYQYEKRVFKEKAGIKYKYCGIFSFIVLVAVCMGILLYITNDSVYMVSERADGYTIEAERLNTSIVREYDFQKGDLIAVRHEHGGGEISIRIGEKDKAPIFTGNSYGEMGDFSVEIQEAGQYEIECIGRRAKGVLRFDLK